MTKKSKSKIKAVIDAVKDVVVTKEESVAEAPVKEDSTLSEGAIRKNAKFAKKFGIDSKMYKRICKK